VIENLGVYESKLCGQFFNYPAIVQHLLSNLDSELELALTAASGDHYLAAEHTKVIIKQLKGHTECQLTNKEAGTITNAAVEVMKAMCNKVCSNDSTVSDIYDKLLGKICMRIDRSSGQKYQVLRSTGKQTNAILSCLEWMRTNVPKFVEEKRCNMKESEKLTFFDGLKKMASPEHALMNMLQLSEHAKSKIATTEFIEVDRRLLANVVLIALSKNQQHVKSIAANYHKVPTRLARTVESKRNTQSKPTTSSETSTEDTTSIACSLQWNEYVCTCLSGADHHCSASKHFNLCLTRLLSGLKQSHLS
jgi:hypothetical protein